MLFGRRAGDSNNLAVLKHLGEIIVSDDRQFYKKLSETTDTQILEFLQSHNIKAETPLQQLREYIRLHKDDEFLSFFDRRITEELLSFEDYELPSYYCKVPALEEILRRKLESEVGKVLKGAPRYSDSDWSYIYSLFIEFVERYSCNYSYDPQTNGITGFLVNTFGFFIKDSMKELLDLVNTKGMNMEFEGADYSTADQAVEEITYFEDLPNFNKLAENIFNASDFLYKHNYKIYYDLFSRYKFKKVKEKFEEINSILSKTFGYSGLYRKPSTYDKNFRVEAGRTSESSKYAQNKMRERDKILGFLDPIVFGGIGPKDLSDVVKRIESYNRDIYSRFGKKESMTVLDYADAKSRTNLSNDDRIKYMILGMSSLRDVVSYLERMGINIFEVPSDIFRDKLLIRRFKTFKQYWELFDVVQELREEEKENTSEDIMTNDEFYSYILDLRVESLKSVPLTDIKNVLDEYKKEDNKTKKSVVESLIDSKKFRSPFLKYQRFSNTGSGEEFGLPEKYHIVSSKILPEVINYLMDAKKISTDNIYWEIDPNFDLKSFVIQKFGEKVYEQGIPPFLEKEGDSLSFIRSFEFIKKFLLYIKDVLVLLDKLKDHRSDLRIYMAIIEKGDMFSMPKDPVNNSEFDWFLREYDVTYYVPKGKELQDINSHLVKLYNIMYYEFEDLFKGLESIHDLVFSSFNLDFIEPQIYEVSEHLLFESSIGIYRSPNIEVVEYDKFKRFKNFCEVDPKYGYLLKNGKMYKQNYFGMNRYLHEKGYWVVFDRQNFSKSPISESDEFN